MPARPGTPSPAACSAKTPLANLVTGIFIMFTLLWITPAFKNMSANVQGAIIIVGVAQLLDWCAALRVCACQGGGARCACWACMPGGRAALVVGWAGPGWRAA